MTVRNVFVDRVRWIMLGIGGVTALLVLGALLIDEGEVVLLVTVDGEEKQHETQLWIADLDGRVYLRAAAPDVRWLGRLRRTPEVTLERGGSEGHFRAVPSEDPELRERLNAAMAAKYGLADWLWDTVGDRTQSVPIRLDPAKDSLPNLHGSAAHVDGAKN